MERKSKTVKEATWLYDMYSPEEFQARKTLAVISAKIQLARLDLKMDQKQFAELMGVSQGMISKWESGDYNFTIEALARIGNKLGISIEALIAPRAMAQYEKYAQADALRTKVPSVLAFSELIVENKTSVNYVEVLQGATYTHRKIGSGGYEDAA